MARRNSEFSPANLFKSFSAPQKNVFLLVPVQQALHYFDWLRISAR
jgi:hypothetical protein